VDPTPDRIIRDTFSDREEAIPFFQSTLPPGLLAVLNLDTLEVEQGTFIDESMNRTDILFRIQTASGSPAEIYLLFEHKSQRDPHIFTQLLSYLTRIYERQDKPLPVIPFSSITERRHGISAPVLRLASLFPKQSDRSLLPIYPISDSNCLISVIRISKR